MNVSPLFPSRPGRLHGFSLVEMLVVIAIISILMTAGAIGINNLGGKGVTSGVDTCEALVDEARSMAIGKNLRTALLIAKNLDNNSTEDRRRILVAHEVDGAAATPNDDDANPDWVVTSRGALLPEQTFFSEVFIRKDHENSTVFTETEIEIDGDKLKFFHKLDTNGQPVYKAVSSSFDGKYYIYRFNSQGMPIDNLGDSMGGASIVIGTGTRMLNKPATDHPPRVTASARRDFGGFVIWRNGRTSVFRSPDQISDDLKGITPGTEF